MKRYEKFVLEAEKGITFEVSEGTSGELIIRALNIATAKVYSTNYVNPPIPEGYKHICGEWNNGFVIERCSDGNQFVWIPVGSLDSNGTLDGEHFLEKFGRRNYRNDEFSDHGFNEALNGELLEQLESVKKYGGFYISRYNIFYAIEHRLAYTRRHTAYRTFDYSADRVALSPRTVNNIFHFLFRFAVYNRKKRV